MENIYTKMSKTFFTADTHYGHSNILKYCNRDFKDIQMHDETLISNFNNKVSSNDDVFHLGDVCFGDENACVDLLNKLNGNIFIIFGNHDRSLRRLARNPQKYGLRSNVRFLGDYCEVKNRKSKLGNDITLAHYAMRVWNKSHHGAWMLYGHSHGSLPDDPSARSIDVGVDCHNYTPIEYKEIESIMTKKNWKPIDHHS